MKESKFSFERILTSAKTRTAVVAIGVTGALPAAELATAQPVMADVKPSPALAQVENPSNKSESSNKDGSGAVTIIVALAAVAAIGLAGLGGGNRRY